MGFPDGHRRVERLEAIACRVPTPAPESDGTLTWDSTTIVIVRAHVGAVVGLGWTYADPACVDLVHGKLAGVIEGADAVDVPARWGDMQRAVRNLGRPGLVSCAMSAVDVALWDAAGQLVGLPVSALLGRVHDRVQVYGSGGFTSYDDATLREELTRWLDHGLTRVKIKIGEAWGTNTARDLSRVQEARTVVGDDVELFTDANGGYRVGAAVRVGHRLDEHGVTWFEEPVSSDDLAGLGAVRAAVSADVTAGEYGYDLPYFAGLVRARAVDCVQVDVSRCGGFTEWLRIAAVAAADNLDVSAHCVPNLSVHAGVATPNLRHLEWFVDHDRIESMLFEGALEPRGEGVAPDGAAPGLGFVLKDGEAERYRVR